LIHAGWLVLVIIQAQVTALLGAALAHDLAHTFLRTAYTAYKRTGLMHEKYDARAVGAIGGGGEYRPQVGFAWTNGVVLDLMQRYGADFIP
jgi:alpha,alpha-trehalase